MIAAAHSATLLAVQVLSPEREPTMDQQSKPRYHGGPATAHFLFLR